MSGKEKSNKLLLKMLMEVRNLLIHVNSVRPISCYLLALSWGSRLYCRLSLIEFSECLNRLIHFNIGHV